jgi:hypothetical protein
MTKPPVALFIFSNNVDNYLHNIENEKKQIRQALEAYHDTNRMTVIMESFTSKKELIRLFQRYEGRIVLFHFSGHAGSKGLQLNENIINTDTAYADGIAGFIAKEAKKQLKLVFLNGCSTAPQVAALKVAGVSNIVATNFSISDNKAANFATHFYRTMANIAKDNPFKEKPITIQDGFESAKNYLQATYKTPIIKDTKRGFVFEESENYQEPWELYAETPEWYLPNIPVKERKLGLVHFAFGFVVLCIAIFMGNWIYQNNLMKTPIDLKVILDDKTPNEELPEVDATVSILYQGKPENHENIKENTVFPTLYRSENEEVELRFRAKGFVDIDTSFVLTKTIELPIRRNDYYANIMGTIVDENGNPLQDANVTIQGITKSTDHIGSFKFTLPPDKQRESQRIDIHKEGYKSKSPTSPIIPNETMRLVLNEN